MLLNSNSHASFRRCSLIFLFALIFIVSIGNCSPAKTRISRRTASVVNNNTELVPQSEKLDVSVPEKLKILKSDGFSFESVVSALSTPESLIQMMKLKDRVMNYFEKRSGDVENTAIEKRGHGHGGHGASSFGHGIGFPSLEGALLALAFLTFAVFLIDLIQRMVGGYSTGYASPFLGRRKREIPDSIGNSGGRRFSTLTSEVLTSIENPLFH